VLKTVKTLAPLRLLCHHFPKTLNQVLLEKPGAPLVSALASSNAEANEYLMSLTRTSDVAEVKEGRTTIKKLTNQR